MEMDLKSDPRIHTKWHERIEDWRGLIIGARAPAFTKERPFQASNGG